MRFLLFEVWYIDSDGHEELIDTTADKSQALRLAEESKRPGLSIVVYEEIEGELEIIKEI